MLSTIIGAIVSAVLSWCLAKWHTYVTNKAALSAQNQPVVQAAADQKAAVTPAQVDNASKEIAKNFGA